MKEISACTCTNVRRTAQTLTDFYDRLLAPSELKVTQFSLLRDLLRCGSVSITALAREVGLDRTTMGKNLQVLARNGLVSFSTGEDRRERMVQVTRKGQHAFEAALPLWEKAQSALTASLGNERLDEFTDLLAQVETTTG